MRHFSRTTWVVGTSGLALVLVLGVLWHTSYDKKPKDEKGTLAIEQNQALKQAITQGFSDQDRDKDGLRDWEEGLWGADPNNPDTDGDGTPDGEEVDNNRSPIKAGPDDTLNASETASSPKDDKKLNSTDKFARSFFADYLTLRQSGQLNTQAGQDILLAQTNTLTSESFTKDYYTKDDIKTSSVNTPDTWRQYGNVIGSIIEQNSTNNRNEAVILLDAMQNGDPKILDELIPIEEAYKNLRTGMQNLVVPSEILPIHLALLNSLARIEFTIGAMQKIFTDPLRTISAMNVYEQNAADLGLAFVDIQSFFNKKGIEFDPGEPGHLTTHMVGEN